MTSAWSNGGVKEGRDQTWTTRDRSRGQTVGQRLGTCPLRSRMRNSSSLISSSTPCKRVCVDSVCALSRQCGEIADSLLLHLDLLIHPLQRAIASIRLVNAGSARVRYAAPYPKTASPPSRRWSNGVPSPGVPSLKAVVKRRSLLESPSPPTCSAPHPSEKRDPLNPKPYTLNTPRSEIRRPLNPKP